MKTGDMVDYAGRVCTIIKISGDAVLVEYIDEQRLWVHRDNLAKRLIRDVFDVENYDHVHCGWCGSDNIEAGLGDFDNEGAWHDHECLDCGGRWWETFKYDGVDFYPGNEGGIRGKDR